MGQDLFKVTQDKIAIEDVIASVSSPAIGAITTFVGVVRNETDGRAVLYLEYEAYPKMAEATLHQIATEIRARWSEIQNVAIVHRTGRLDIGEVAVVIALSAAHRRQTFDALRYAIDRLKEIVPIWKKEVWSNGAEWKSETIPDAQR